MLWLIIALIVTITAFLMYVFPIIQVCGDSMYPTFNDGDIILGCRLFSLKESEVYVYKSPADNKTVIKRLLQISNITGKLFFTGDNSDHSYDSRMYGYITKDKVIARYILTIHKRKECSDNGCK